MWVVCQWSCVVNVEPGQNVINVGDISDELVRGGGKAKVTADGGGRVK